MRLQPTFVMGVSWPVRHGRGPQAGGTVRRKSGVAGAPADNVGGATERTRLSHVGKQDKVGLVAEVSAGKRFACGDDDEGPVFNSIFNQTVTDSLHFIRNYDSRRIHG